MVYIVHPTVFHNHRSCIDIARILHLLHISLVVCVCGCNVLRTLVNSGPLHPHPSTQTLASPKTIYKLTCAHSSLKIMYVFRWRSNELVVSAFMWPITTSKTTYVILYPPLDVYFICDADIDFLTDPYSGVYIHICVWLVCVLENVYLNRGEKRLANCRNEMSRADFLRKWEHMRRRIYTIV